MSFSRSSTNKTISSSSFILPLWRSLWLSPIKSRENYQNKENSYSLSTIMWKSFCNCQNLTYFGYRKRMAFYLCLFIFYSVQLALYRKSLNEGVVHDSKINGDYLIAIDVLMLVQSLVALGFGWILRPIFQNISMIFNAILFGLTFGWLILAAPNADEHQVYYAINGIVVILLIVIDVSGMLHVRPEIIGTKGRAHPNRKSLLNPAQISTGSSSSNTKLSTSDKLRGAVSSILPSFGKVRHRFLHSEEDGNHIQQTRPMAEKADEEMGSGSDKEEFVNVFGKDSTNMSRRNSSNSAPSTTALSASTSPFHADDTSVITAEGEIIYGGYKIDTNDKQICEGFRINMGNVPSFDDSHTPRNLTWDDFTQIQHIVDSSSCHIYTALWKNQQHVVLKLIKAERVSSAIAVAEFEAEEGVLSRIRHPNIVQFLGSGKVPRKFLVLELLAGGSLSHVLGLRADSRNQTWEKRFTFLETLDFSLSLARALKYLHHDWSSSVHIIHRDLKPDNIGFAIDGRVKLFDFGLCASVRAQREKTEQYRLTGNTGTLRYMAPEVVLGRSYHQSVDVYSFGILLWQVASGKVPFRDMGKKTYFDRVVVGGQRPRIDSRWPLAFGHLLRHCWHEDKHARPSFQTIVTELEVLVRQEENMVLAQHNQLHRRVARSCLWCIIKFRPVFLMLIVAVFLFSLFIVVDQDDTVLGAVLGAISTFGIYMILMSYLSVWPSALSSSTEDIVEKIEQQRKMRAITSAAKIVQPPNYHNNSSSNNSNNNNSNSSGGNLTLKRSSKLTQSASSLNNNNNNSNNNASNTGSMIEQSDNYNHGHSYSSNAYPPQPPTERIIELRALSNRNNNSNNNSPVPAAGAHLAGATIV